jgi:integrase
MAIHDSTPSPSRPALSDALARQLHPLPKRIVYDGGPDRLRGFGLRLSPTARTWILNYVTTGGRERRLVIGAFPTWSAKQARTRAAELRRLIDQGRDPLADRQAERSAPTIAELLDEYEETASGKRSWRDDKAMIAAYIRPRWAARKVSEVTADDIEALHREITRRAPIRANRVIAVVSAMFKLAIKRRFVTDNPCRGIERNAETKRTRYLTAPELARLVATLDGWADQVSAAAIRLLLLTGCRKSELLGATWDEFDLDAGVWVKPAARVKANREHRLPLSPQAVAELHRLPRTGPLVFTNSRGKPWTEVAAWPAIREAAGIADVRLHDLRHSAASLLISRGLSLPVIGRILGHSQASTTERYAHLHDAPVIAAVADLGHAIGGPPLRLVR